MNTLAIYARHSTDKQDTSTDDQIARCKRWADKNNYVITEIYSDEAVSGTHMNNRLGITNMIDGAVKEKFSFILAEDLSRISRDQGDIAQFYKKMEFLDVKVITVSEGIINELHIGLKGTMNALYIKDLADKTMRGMIASVLKGSVPGGRAYGYGIKKEVVNNEVLPGRRYKKDDEVAIIRRIYKEYHSGSSLKKICNRLNVDNIPSPTGKEWNSTTLCGSFKRQTGILRQSLYKGVITFNRVGYKKHPDTGNRITVPKPKHKWIKVPIPELAIIPEAEFDQVQEMLVARKGQASRTRAETLALNDKRHRATKEKRRLKVLAERTGRVNRASILTSRTSCPDCNDPIKSIRKDLLSCVNLGCRNRNIDAFEAIEAVQFEFAKLLPKDVEKYNDLTEDTRVNLQKERLRNIARLTQKKIELKNMLDQLKTIKLGPTSLNFIQELEDQIHIISNEVKSIDEELKNVIELSRKEATEIHSKLKILFGEYKANIHDPVIVDRLRRFIIKIELTKFQTTKTEAKIKFDWPLIIKNFK